MGIRRGTTATVALCALVAAAPAHGAFPGVNGKLAFYDSGPHTINPDGGGRTALPLSPGWAPTWSPDGRKIASATFTGVQVSNPDGSGAETVYDLGTQIEAIDWSPDGQQLVVWDHVVRSHGEADSASLDIFNANGSAPHLLVDPGPFAEARGLSWSPLGDRIAFHGSFGGELGIYTIKPDGTGLQQITDQNRWDPDFSPNAAKLVATRWDGAQTDVVVMNADGSGEIQLTTSPSYDDEPAWSPDGTKIIFHSTRSPDGLYVMDSDGSNQAFLTQSQTGAQSWTRGDWQPIPVNAYPRPKGASPTDVSLVPAYEPCTAPNRTHGPPLAFDSCNPPAQTPGELTVGTPDANGQPAKLRAHVRINPLRGNPSTSADEADVRLRASVNDVRLRSDLSDYTGALELRLTLQITDRDNTPHPGGPGPATVEQFTHSQPLPCSTTPADATAGSTCQFDTTVEALVPGAVKELTRAIWQLERITVNDGAGNPFLTQGIFVP